MIDRKGMNPLTPHHYSISLVTRDDAWVRMKLKEDLYFVLLMVCEGRLKAVILIRDDTHLR